MFTFVLDIGIAFSSLKSNKLRAALTMLGITIGVGAVVTLVSLGQSVEYFIVDQFTTLGANLIFVMGKESRTLTNEYEANSDADVLEPLSERDLRVLSDPQNVPGAEFVVPYMETDEPLTYAGREHRTRIGGIVPEYFDVVNMEIALGRSITQQDVDSTARVVVLGKSVVTRLFEDHYPVGRTIRIEDVPFRVVGVLDDINVNLGVDANDFVFVPITTAQRRLSSGKTVTGEYLMTSIMIRTYTEDQLESTSRQIRQVLREEHELDAGDDDDFYVMSQVDILDSLKTVTGILTVFLGVVAGISLLVGGIGIMNIMLVTVTERTHEIGIRKAVGAQRRDILLQFLVESVTLAVFGGLIGTLFAMGSAALATALVPDLNVTVQWSGVVLATSISAAIGTFFGIYPANRAANLKPIDALRYE